MGIICDTTYLRRWFNVTQRDRTHENFHGQHLAYDSSKPMSGVPDSLEGSG